MRFFALRMTVGPKIPGAVIPRRVFTQPGSIASFERCRHVCFTANSGRIAASQRTDALTDAPQQQRRYSITHAGAGEHRRQKVSSAANPVVVTGAYSGPVVRGRAIPVNSATTSAWRLHPVLARTRPSWVCTVSGDTPPSMAMSLGVRPEARDRATRASAGVKIEQRLH